MVHSFSGKGNLYDNTCIIESFHSGLKKVEIHLHTYQDSKEARRAIFEYLNHEMEQGAKQASVKKIRVHDIRHGAAVCKDSDRNRII